MKASIARLLLILLAATAVFGADPDDRRVPPPSHDAVASKLKPEFAAFARGLLASASVPTNDKGQPDATTRFARLEYARRLAIDAREIGLATDVIEAMAERFTVDYFKLRFDAVLAVGKQYKATEARETIVAAADALCDEAVSADRYDITKPLGDFIAFNLPGIADPALQADVTRHSQRARECEKEFPGFTGAIEVLRTTPDNPQANLTAGKFYCFLKADWDRGLPMLLKCGHDDLAKLAKRDTEADNVADALAVAKGWSDLSNELLGPSRDACRARALGWYQVAIRRLQGNAKAQAEALANELSPLKTAAAPVQ